ncbi:Uncharacterized protein Rs2_16981 [Raphanus sativus]|nr:Uncharacterized protein Rs2_16981 [Raphanus sativus]
MGSGVKDHQKHPRAFLNNRSSNGNNKRPRSPSDDGHNKSPSRDQYPAYSRGEKRSKDSASYWTSRNQVETRRTYKGSDQRREDRYERYPSRNTSVWNRLDQQAPRRPLETSDALKRYQDKRRDSERNRGKSYHSAHHSQQSTRVWRSKELATESRSNNQSRLEADTAHRALPSRTVTDSQLTISEARPGRKLTEAPGHGVLVVHRNESTEDRMRRLKGKAPMYPESEKTTPISAAKNPPSGLLTRNIGIIAFRTNDDHTVEDDSRYASPEARTRTEKDSLDLDKMMESEHIDKMILTKNDEAALSQVKAVYNAKQRQEPRMNRKTSDTPAYAENTPMETEEDHNLQPTKDKAGSIEVSRQGDKTRSPARKRHPQSPSGKGTRASKKMSYPRGRPVMKLTKETGVSVY